MRRASLRTGTERETNVPAKVTRERRNQTETQPIRTPERETRQQTVKGREVRRTWAAGNPWGETTSNDKVSGLAKRGKC